MANAAAEARHRLGSPAPPEDAAGYVQVDGLRLRVERRGAGPPLVLINGIGAPIEMWEPFTRRLPDRELILFDLPGSGRSQPPRLPMRMSGYARVVVELMDVLGLGRADVLGYSYGGLVAQELARRSPVRVRKLVLCATFAGVPSVPPDLLVLLLMSTPLRYRSRRMGAVIVPRIAGGRTARDPRALNRDLDHRQASPPSVLGYAHQVYAAAGWSSQRWLPGLRQPTLVVHGDDDPLVPPINARWLARRIPDAKLHVVRGAGHLLLIDEPAKVVGRINHFLAS